MDQSWTRIPGKHLAAVVDDGADWFGPQVDVARYYREVQFLLTRHDDFDTQRQPLSRVVWGGTRFRGVDSGYGPPRSLSVDDVAEIAASLRALPDGVVRTRFDEIRRWHEHRTFSTHLDEHLVPTFEALCAFFLHAARAGEAVVIDAW